MKTENFREQYSKSTVTVPSFVKIDCVTGDEGTVTVNEGTVTVDERTSIKPYGNGRGKKSHNTIYEKRYGHGDKFGPHTVR